MKVWLAFTYFETNKDLINGINAWMSTLAVMFLRSDYKSWCNAIINALWMSGDYVEKLYIRMLV